MFELSRAEPRVTDQTGSPCSPSKNSNQLVDHWPANSTHGKSSGGCFASGLTVISGTPPAGQNRGIEIHLVQLVDPFQVERIGTSVRPASPRPRQPAVEQIYFVGT